MIIDFSQAIFDENFEEATIGDDVVTIFSTIKKMLGMHSQEGDRVFDLLYIMKDAKKNKVDLSFGDVKFLEKVVGDSRTYTAFTKEQVIRFLKEERKKFTDEEKKEKKKTRK